jgi:hypothetical protein
LLLKELGRVTSGEFVEIMPESRVIDCAELISLLKVSITEPVHPGRVVKIVFSHKVRLVKTCTALAEDTPLKKKVVALATIVRGLREFKDIFLIAPLNIE